MASEGNSPARAKGTGRSGKQVRKLTRAGSDTRTKLLDAAEQLFADDGYEGASLRDVSLAAGVHLALSTYHFGSKERLFGEVIGRRATEINRLRLEALARIDPAAQSPSDTVRLLIRAYVSPFIEARYGRSQQWQAYARLAAGLVNDRRWARLVRKYYDECAHAYFVLWRQALPDADKNALLNAMSFMAASMLYVCSYTNRFSRWKTRFRSRKSELDAVTEDLIRFVHAGFMSLAPQRTGRTPSHAKPRRA